MTSTPIELSAAALAFRGYNVTNLGRTAELLATGAYRSIVVEELERYSAICREVTAAPVDLIRIVEAGVEPDLEQYASAISLIVG